MRDRPFHELPSYRVCQKAAERVMVYVAGPYTGESEREVQTNIEVATRVAVEAIKRGWLTYTPHRESGFLDAYKGLTSAQDFWYEWTISAMLRCDAVVLCPGWQGSIGTTFERRVALEAGVPVYDTVDELPMARDFKSQ